MTVAIVDRLPREPSPIDYVAVLSSGHGCLLGDAAAGAPAVARASQRRASRTPTKGKTRGHPLNGPVISQPVGAPPSSWAAAGPRGPTPSPRPHYQAVAIAPVSARLSTEAAVAAAAAAASAAAGSIAFKTSSPRRPGSEVFRGTGMPAPEPPATSRPAGTARRPAGRGIMAATAATREKSAGPTAGGPQRDSRPVASPQRRSTGPPAKLASDIADIDGWLKMAADAVRDEPRYDAHVSTHGMQQAAVGGHVPRPPSAGPPTSRHRRPMTPGRHGRPSPAAAPGPVDPAADCPAAGGPSAAERPRSGRASNRSSPTRPGFPGGAAPVSARDAPIRRSGEISRSGSQGSSAPVAAGQVVARHSRPSSRGSQQPPAQAQSPRRGSISTMLAAAAANIASSRGPSREQVEVHTVEEAGQGLDMRVPELAQQGGAAVSSTAPVPLAQPEGAVPHAAAPQQAAAQPLGQPARDAKPEHRIAEMWLRLSRIVLLELSGPRPEPPPPMAMLGQPQGRPWAPASPASGAAAEAAAEEAAEQVALAAARAAAKESDDDPDGKWQSMAFPEQHFGIHGAAACDEETRFPLSEETVSSPTGSDETGVERVTSAEIAWVRFVTRIMRVTAGGPEPVAMPPDPDAEEEAQHAEDLHVRFPPRFRNGHPCLGDMMEESISWIEVDSDDDVHSPKQSVQHMPDCEDDEGEPCEVHPAMRAIAVQQKAPGIIEGMPKFLSF
eukprot:TRINITY_DN10228_c0_g1_i9.p1 TRINITY_DN10228_c0_g1~~TRINITY_DN10228_c0_g1_i9.p1  ORF type:complete len:725 (-),score=131.06 TRINITY_DN10228_c0_g1_i9:220-2394(-)